MLTACRVQSATARTLTRFWIVGWDLQDGMRIGAAGEDVVQPFDEKRHIKVGTGLRIAADRVELHPSVAARAPCLLGPRGGAAGLEFQLVI